MGLLKKISILILLLFLVTGCNPYKHLNEGESLLTKNKVKIHPGKYEGEQLEPVIKQQPNRKTLWLFRVQLGIYNHYDPEKLKIRNQKKRIRWDKKNARRMAKGKDTLDFVPKWGARILAKSGEPPVVYDSSASYKTLDLLNQFMFDEGYFNSETSFSTKTKKKGKKTIVTYHVNPHTPYRINQFSTSMNDTNMRVAVKKAVHGTEIKPGNRYQVATINNERSRFSTAIRDQGYYYFNKEYVSFEIDSTIGNHLVNVRLILKDMVKHGTTSSGKDSLIVRRHEKYRVKNIYVNTSFSPRFQDDYTDSLHFKDLIFINKKLLLFYPRPIRNSIFIHKGDLYNESGQKYTYTRLAGTGNFKFVNINYEDSDEKNMLDCKITMTPFPHQSIGLEAEGTHSSGNLGVSGYLSYNNRNIFRGMEILNIRIKGGVEAQQTNSTASDGGNTTFEIFNTVEYGIEASITQQKLLFITKHYALKVPKYQNPKTKYSIIYNFQNRPDFKRLLINVSMSYNFSIKKINTNSFKVTPVNVSFIRINKSAQFQKKLDDLNNPLLNATYDDVFILGTQLTHGWTNKKSTKQTNYIVNQALIETAGNVLQLSNLILNSEKVNNDGDTYYQIGGVRYAQFLKLQEDIRYRSQITKHHRMAYRLITGVGLSYGNSIAMPYDKSFYGGGANDNRAWRARSLGPGSMNDTLKGGIDQVADFKLGASIEYRFDIFRKIEGALFIDAGNIWLLRKDEERLNAEFSIARFYKEIAIGAGPGLRFNFGFLLVRFDFGFRLYDPGLPEKERWVFNNKDYFRANNIKYNYVTFNLGIDYPF